LVGFFANTLSDSIGGVTARQTNASGRLGVVWASYKFNAVMERLGRRTWNGTQQQRVVRSNVLALNSQREVHSSETLVRPNVELAKLACYWILVSARVFTLKTKISKLMEDSQLKSEIGIVCGECGEVRRRNRVRFELCHGSYRMYIH
jgi:hypothetical protein